MCYKIGTCCARTAPIVIDPKLPNYIPRLLDPVLDEILLEHPAVMIVGPRAVGKTTMLARRAASAVRLQRAAERDAVQADPYAVLRGLPRPTMIDEWQLVPEVLAAVKDAVDEGAPPGSFLITGSVRADLSPQGWPMTGRVVRLPMFGLTPRELSGGAGGGSFLDVARENSDALHTVTGPRPDLRDYVEQALASGFPEVVRASSNGRRRFLSSYADQIVGRDLDPIWPAVEPVKVRRYLQAIAANTAGMVEHKTLYDAAGIARATAVAYDDSLERLVVTERLPAWSSNLLSRLSGTPKRHLIDPALIVPLIGVDERAVLRNGDLLGRVVESFVLAQLRVDSTLSQNDPRLYHLRDTNGRHEIDIVAEFPNGDLVAIEVKAAAAPGLDAARHLEWLRDHVGAKFRAGIVAHTGERSFRGSDRIHFLPIATIAQSPD